MTRKAGKRGIEIIRPWWNIGNPIMAYDFRGELKTFQNRANPGTYDLTLVNKPMGDGTVQRYLISDEREAQK